MFPIYFKLLLFLIRNVSLKKEHLLSMAHLQRTDSLSSLAYISVTDMQNMDYKLKAAASDVKTAFRPAQSFILRDYSPPPQHI